MKKENLNVNTSNCHSGLDPESHEMLNQVQHDRIMEQGRSMVEMLGVLAIMGLLTIIGIAGFRIALNKHYANQTVERLMRRAVVVAGQANFGQTLSLHEFDADDGEYPITLLDRTDNESFTMQADNVPNEVCQLIVELDWKMAKIIPEDCSDTTMKFKFLNDLTDCSTCVAESVDCPPASEMQCGTCSVVRGFIDNDADCEGNENGGNCIRGKCMQCDIGDFWWASHKQCEICQNVSSYWATPDIYSHHCLGTMVYSGYAIYGCLYAKDLASADELSCKECEDTARQKNHCYNAANGSCHLIGETQTYRRDSEGNCECVDDSFWYTSRKICLSCQTDGDFYSTTPENRARCLGTRFVSTNCGSNYCLFSCTFAGDRSGADEEGCKACEDSEGKKNRCYLNGICYLAGEGQAHQRVSETDGTCQQ